MTTPIQAAIEALPRWSMKINGNPSMTEALVGNWLWRDDVLAALQAAPAQGSIDTADEQAAFEKDMQQHGYWSDLIKLPSDAQAYRHKHVADMWTGWQARARIAQRAASGDAMEDPILVPRGLIGAACYVLRKHDPNSKTLAQLRSLTFGRAAPGPIADEVAGCRTERDGWEAATKAVMKRAEGQSRAGRDDLFHELRQCVSMLHDQKPPAPKASAPDAPEGDLPPLPLFGIDVEADTGYGEKQRYQGFEPDQMRAYVLADRAARGAAAPAGHAEPVGHVEAEHLELLKQRKDVGAYIKMYAVPFGPGGTRDMRPIYAGPVAAEPAPAIPAQPGTSARVVTHGDSITHYEKGGANE